MESQQKTLGLIDSLLREQRYAVLSTQAETGPYCSLVAFWSADDLLHVVFPTLRATRKFTYLVSHPRVALLFDDRTNVGLDIDETTAVTATGVAREITAEPAYSEAASAFLDKHPALSSFLAGPDCALVRVDVEAYFVVTRFQNLVELRMGDSQPKP